MKIIEGYMRLALNQTIEVKSPILGWRPCQVVDDESGLIGVVLVFATQEQAKGKYDWATLKMTWSEADGSNAPY